MGFAVFPTRFGFEATLINTRSGGTSFQEWLLSIEKYISALGAPEICSQKPILPCYSNLNTHASDIRFLYSCNKGHKLFLRIIPTL